MATTTSRTGANATAAQVAATKAILDRLATIDSARRALGGSRYETKEILAKSVAVDGFDQFGRALVTIEGEQRPMSFDRGTAHDLPSYDIAIQEAKKAFNYKDNADNITTVPAGTERYVLVATAA